METSPMTILRTRRGALRLCLAAGLGPGLAACGPGKLIRLDGGEGPDGDGPEPRADAIVTARGAFEGLEGARASGHGRVLRSGGRWIIELEEDFAVEAGPEPRVFLGEGGMIREAALGPLGAPAGRQAYALPEGLDIGDYTEIWIWCPARAVPLAVARLQLT
jgi:hypothetical protein